MESSLKGRGGFLFTALYRIIFKNGKFDLWENGFNHVGVFLSAFVSVFRNYKDSLFQWAFFIIVKLIDF